MERRYELRLAEMLAHAEVSPDLTRGLLERLESFVEPFADSLSDSAQQRHALEYLTGLLSKLERKNSEAIAYLLDQNRKGLQSFVAEAPWEHAPLIATLATQVDTDLGEPGAVIVFDPSAFPKKGTKSVGVARQWCGRLGKVDNCQVGVFMAYVSKQGHALVNTRIYLPREWTKNRARLKEAGVPRGTKFRTRHELALEMLDECGKTLRHGWVAGDDEMGRPSGFRRELQGRNERYLLAVPSNTLVRDLDETPPEYAGRGRRPMSPFRRLDRWRAALPKDAWTRVDVRDGEKGPLAIEVVKRRVQARTETGGTAPEELLFVTRELLSNGTHKHDYYFSNADPKVTLIDLASVTKAAHRIEECLKNAKGEAGLADYQVRTWTAWHRHQTLSLLAAWFLNQETRRKKNPDPGSDDAATSSVDCRDDRGASQGEHRRAAMPQKHTLAATNRTSAIVSPQGA